LPNTGLRQSSKGQEGMLPAGITGNGERLCKGTQKPSHNVPQATLYYVTSGAN